MSPSPSAGQDCASDNPGSDFCDRLPPQQLRWEAATLGVNALLGALTAGVTQHVQKGSFWDGFRRGAVGGAVVFAGKRLSVEQFPSAGLMGREVAATGSSMIRNAAADRPSLSELVLPVGPVRLYLRPRRDTPIRLQLDVVNTISLARALADPDIRFVLETSLSSGAPVFRQEHATGRTPWRGSETAGVIRLSGDSWMRGPDYWGRVLAHERVHVLQYDQGFIVGGQPLEAALLPLIPAGTTLNRWFDFGLETPFWALLNHTVPYRDRPWESEAELLGRTRGSEARDGGMNIGDGGLSAPVGARIPSHPDM